MKSRNKSKKSKVAIAVKRRRESARKKSAARLVHRQWWRRIKSVKPAMDFAHLITSASNLVPSELKKKIIDLMTDFWDLFL